MFTLSPKIRLLVPAVFATGALLAVTAGCAQEGNGSGHGGTPEIAVYKTATCGCCNAWVDHLREEGFSVTTRDVSQDQLNTRKHSAGLTYGLASCHTAFVDGYTIEGHVPADDIHRLLEEKPEAAGLTVPGMPVGSPGMEQGERRDPYDVLIFDHDGNTEVYASYHQ